MAKYARIGSSETLKDLRGALAGFAHGVSVALEGASSEIARTLHWLRLDQQSYWKLQLRQRSEKLTLAKSLLKRKKDLEVSPLGVRHAYLEEEKAVAAAERALREAQQKCHNIKNWIIKLEQHQHEFRGQVQGLANLVEMDVPRARAILERMSDSLEAYAQLAPASGTTADDTIEKEAATQAVEPEAPEERSKKDDV